jgi:hypothetical protein
VTTLALKNSSQVAYWVRQTIIGQSYKGCYGNTKEGHLAQLRREEWGEVEEREGVKNNLQRKIINLKP